MWLGQPLSSQERLIGGLRMLSGGRQSRGVATAHTWDGSTTMNRVLERSELDTGDDVATEQSARRGPLRRRFTFVSVGLLSILLAVLGVNFAADTGTVSPTVTGRAGIDVNSGTPQTWAVSVGSAGTVTSAPTATQYVAAIDPKATTSTQMTISLYVTNMAELAANYSSWNFNIGLYSAPDTPFTRTDGAITTWTPATAVWTLASSASPTGSQVVTSDAGTLSWVVTLEADKVYALRLEKGGSFYTIGAANNATASLSPRFFVRATELGPSA